MKRVRKGVEPAALARIVRTHPRAEWKDPIVLKAKPEIRRQVALDQGWLCAYCESRLIEPTPDRWGIEHFVAKSLTGPSGPNWHLDWNNMLGVCRGGEADPKPRALHCDRYKNVPIKKPPLPEDCRGWILNPFELPALPSLFSLEYSTGVLSPDTTACQAFGIQTNHYPTVVDLVQATIDHLNLNCRKLCEKRRVVCEQIDVQINQARQRGKTMADLCASIFKDSTTWPEFFTVYLIRLGTSAQTFLQKSQYCG
ncbi:TIGR02646 family protein [Myxococcota bacterium]|nr:TIGR02646 family protein [Myxococcota bacterium]